MTTFKKILRYLSSMQFAIFLLVIIAAACAAASFITQGLSYERYAALYGERGAAFIVALGLDDAFHSPWIIAMTAFLILNLVLCNLIRLPSLINRTKAELDASGWVGRTSDIAETGVEEPEKVFSALRMPKPEAGQNERGRWLFSSKNTVGLWGAWICHLGILLLILGFGLGQALTEETSVYGVAGDTMRVGETSLFLTIDDFTVEKRGDDSVSQYISAISVRNVETQEVRSAVISVNEPADLFGLSFYQNSTGWAARVNITKDGEPLQSEVLCSGDYVAVADKPELVVMLAHLYPDYYYVPGSTPTTLSNDLNNPAYLYMVYYAGEMLGMNVLMPGEELKIDEYTVTFTDPQAFTLIAVRRDPFSWLAFLGGVILTLGLALALYFQPRKVWAVEEDGGWAVYGESAKGGAIFRNEFNLAVKKVKNYDDA